MLDRGPDRGCLNRIPGSENQRRSLLCPATAVSSMGTISETGVIVLTCGTYGNVIRFLPPLAISDELLLEGIDVIAQALRADGGDR